SDLRDIRDQVLRALSEDSETAAPLGAILYGLDIAPTRFLETDWSRGGGIALEAGSTASHVAMLARSRGVPMVVGIGAFADEPTGNALLDAEHGGIVLSPSPKEIEAFRQSSSSFAARQGQAQTFLAQPAATKAGTSVRVQVNIAYPSDVDGIDIATCDGVGLMRTEFLFGKALPDEETQYQAYRKVLEWAGEKPVTIRTIDAGGDKPIPDFTVEETNPFLGLRGIRLSLARSDIFRVQIRALLRASDSLI
ncbi:MAG: phosphoenolpyruvate--protein phosphotransferase, partial [Mesorhizobium sp.]